MHFYVPAKAGERPGDKAQSAPRYVDTTSAVQRRGRAFPRLSQRAVQERWMCVQAGQKFQVSKAPLTHTQKA